MGGKSLTNTLGTLTSGEIANGTLTKNGSSFNLQNGTLSAATRERKSELGKTLHDPLG